MHKENMKIEQESASAQMSFITRISPSICCRFRGFCYFNSVAIAAKLLQQRLNVSKILIVDWVSVLSHHISVT